jgi:GlpG protein
LGEAEESFSSPYGDPEAAASKPDLSETLATIGIGPLTFALTLGCILTGIVSKFGGNVETLQPLFVTAFRVQGEYATWVQGLPEIRSGEIWRLFSPVLVHFGILHLLFNMLWFVVMASLVESRERTAKLMFLILAIGSISNLAEYLLTGPYFGGMSGVLYGLLGYIWMKVKFDPLSGYFLGMNTVTLLMIWFFVCLLGVIPNVANMAHVFGLLSGFALGFVSSIHANHRR